MSPDAVGASVPAPAAGRVRAVLGLGSNVGDRLELLQSALDTLDDTPGIDVAVVSPAYDTVPVGGPPDQPLYLNAVALVDTVLSARALLERCRTVEDAYGRIRAERWGPRTLDIDIITYDGEISDDPVLTLPHPRAAERAFVLVPWAAVEPAAVLPGAGSVAELAAALSGKASDVVRRDDLVLRLPEDR